MSARLPIWIVEGHTGEYSDRREWPVAAFPSKEQADVFMLICETWAAKNNLFRPRSRRGHVDPERHGPPMCLPEVLAWLKTQRGSGSADFGVGRDEDFDWMDNYQWRTSVSDAIQAGALNVPDPGVASADRDGVDYVVYALGLTILDRHSIDAFADALVALRPQLPTNDPLIPPDTGVEKASDVLRDGGLEEAISGTRS